MNIKDKLLKKITEGITLEAEFEGEVVRFVSPKHSDFMKLATDSKEDSRDAGINLIIDCVRDEDNNRIFTNQNKAELKEDRSGFFDFAIEHIIKLRLQTIGETIEEKEKN